MDVTFFWRIFGGEPTFFMRCEPPTCDHLLEDVLTATAPVSPISYVAEIHWRKELLRRLDAVLSGEKETYHWGGNERGSCVIEPSAAIVYCNFGDQEIVLDPLGFRELLLALIDFIDAEYTLDKSATMSIDL